MLYLLKDMENKQFLSVKEHRQYLHRLLSLPAEHSPLLIWDEMPTSEAEHLSETFFLHRYWNDGEGVDEDYDVDEEDYDVDEFADWAISPHEVSPFKNFLLGWEMEDWSSLLFPPSKGVTLFVGNGNKSSGGEPQQLGGYRCYSIAKRYFNVFPDVVHTKVLLDSGVFSLEEDSRRLEFSTVLDNQLLWEHLAAHYVLGVPNWRVHALSSYDWLIWEKHESLKAPQSEEKVERTVAAAIYLTQQRSRLENRHLILVCQGSEPQQYQECVERVLSVAQSSDWIGLGGFAKLGANRSNLPVYFEILHRIIPLIARSSVRHIHVFGCLYDRAIAPTLYLCDRYNLTLSVDSTRPIRDSLCHDKDKAGARCNYWRTNCWWWSRYMSSMAYSPYYKEPPRLAVQFADSMSLFAD
jgi:hypothetical protein